MGSFKKVAVVLFLTFALIVGIGLRQMQYSEAAIPVVDMKNIWETHLALIEQAKTALNTWNMVQNQIKNLTSLSGTLLGEIRSAIDTSVSEILAPLKEIRGLAADRKQTGKSWEQTFDSVEDIYKFNAIDRVKHEAKMTAALDKTYQDTLNIQGLVSQIEKDQEQLEKLMAANASAEGAKAVGQTSNQLIAMLIAQSMRYQQILASIARADVAQKSYHNQVEIQAQATAAKESENWQKIGSESWDNLVEKSGTPNFH